MLPVNTRIVIQGLQSAPEYNDKEGTIESFDEHRGRYIVLLGDGSTIALKPGSVRLSQVEVDAVSRRMQADMAEAAAASDEDRMRMMQVLSARCLDDTDEQQRRANAGMTSEEREQALDDNVLRDIRQHHQSNGSAKQLSFWHEQVPFLGLLVLFD